MTQAPRRALCCVALALASGWAAADEAPRELEVGAHERLLVVAPHPDDETLGAAGLAQRVLARGVSSASAHPLVRPSTRQQSARRVTRVPKSGW